MGLRDMFRRKRADKRTDTAYGDSGDDGPSPFTGWLDPEGELARELRPTPHPAPAPGPLADAAPEARPMPEPQPARADVTPKPGLVVGTSESRPGVEMPAFYAANHEDTASEPAHAAGRLSAEKRALVREAWGFVSARSDQLVREFYAELFLRVPEAMHMFPSSMVRQREDFGRALVQWVVADDPDELTVHLDQLGADHRKYDVEPRHYDAAGAALLAVWKRLAERNWTERHEAAVWASYTRLATIMIDGAMRTQHEPATWGARVVEHERVAPDFAIVRIQPDAPYPYKPGQYLTLELPAHRKQWRQMSIASSPRPDNTFDLQVRAVGGTGVSAALVGHTEPGDRVRLGPPRGNSLVVEPGSIPNGVLCIASGTGAAPITAVVEYILEWDEMPEHIYAYIGGRTHEDIYPVTHMEKLVHGYGRSLRVHVHGVVSEDADYVGYKGRVDSVVPMLHDWAELGVDVLIAGPDAMIAGTVASLVNLGVPRSRIRFDQYELPA